MFTLNRAVPQCQNLRYIDIKTADFHAKAISQCIFAPPTLPKKLHTMHRLEWSLSRGWLRVGEGGSAGPIVSPGGAPGPSVSPGGAPGSSVSPSGAPGPSVSPGGGPGTWALARAASLGRETPGSVLYLPLSAWQ